jgi:DNA/RNA-binding domain of Phe-tRNA-synthetase-like protein
VLSKYPGTKMGILLMHNVNPKAAADHATDTASFYQAIQKRYDGVERATLKTMPPIEAYVAYYRQFKQNYHLLPQLESIVSGKMPRNARSPLLQAMFFTEIETMLLTAGHDLAQLKGQLTLQLASGKEKYQAISGKEVDAVKDDIILCDEQGVISSILRGPDHRSRITNLTQSALFTVYAPPYIDSERIQSHLTMLEARVKAFSVDAQTELCNVSS